MNLNEHQVADDLEQNEDELGLEMLPAPARRAGLFLSTIRYFLSTFLSFLNPYILSQLRQQLKGQILRMEDMEDVTDFSETYVQSNVFRPPVSGEWNVLRGGITKELSHSWNIISQRYAYDFAQADDHGERHARRGEHLDDYYCYRQIIFAPADGVVVRVRDGLRDSPAPGTLWLNWRARDICGNTITIDHGNHEFSFMAHLIPGSIKVHVGDKVFLGQPIAECGNSGHSTEPHLHFQVQDRADFFTSISLPIRFSHCSVNGGSPLAPVFLKRGDKFKFIDPRLP
jgi:hypothetical protein